MDQNNQSSNHNNDDYSILLPVSQHEVVQHCAAAPFLTLSQDNRLVAQVAMKFR
jgi:hypothetical protein